MKYRNLSDIRRALFFIEEPVIPDSGGGGSAEPPAADPAPIADPAPPTPVPEPVVPEPVTLQDGQIAMTKEDAEQLKWYQQFNPNEVYQKFTTTPADPTKQPEDPRAQEIKQVQDLMFEAFPALKQLPNVMQHNMSTRNNFADAAMGRALESAEKNEMKFENENDKNEFLTLVTMNIKGSPTAHKRFLAGDLSVVDSAFESVAKRYYNKSFGTLPPPVPRNKLTGGKPIIKGKGPSGLKNAGEDVALDMETAGDNAFERLQSIIKE